MHTYTCVFTSRLLLNENCVQCNELIFWNQFRFLRIQRTVFTIKSASATDLNLIPGTNWYNRHFTQSTCMYLCALFRNRFVLFWFWGRRWFFTNLCQETRFLFVTPTWLVHFFLFFLRCRRFSIWLNATLLHQHICIYCCCCCCCVLKWKSCEEF